LLTSDDRPKAVAYFTPDLCHYLLAQMHGQGLQWNFSACFPREQALILFTEIAPEVATKFA